MNDRTTVIITMLIVLIVGIGVYAEAFLNGGSNRTGSGGSFREVILNDPQSTLNNSTNITGNITQAGNISPGETGTGTGTGNIAQGTGVAGTGTGTGTGTGAAGTGTGTGVAGTGTGTGTGTGPAETRNDTSDAPRGRIITDMFGREVTIPVQINRIVADTMLTTPLLYKFAPDKLGAWNWMPRGQFLKQRYRELPVIGSFVVGGTGNPEALMAMRPCIMFKFPWGDIRITGPPRQEDIDTLNEKQAKLGGIPVVGIRAESITNVTRLEESIRFVGELLGTQQRAAELIEFYNIRHRIRRTVANIPENERVTVLHVRGPKGLQVTQRGSIHAMIIEMSGGINVADLPEGASPTPAGARKGWLGRVTVSLEQILAWNPEVLLVHDPTFYRNVFNDSRWQNVRAVQNRRVYLIPGDPFNWFEGPSSTNRILGIPWTATTLYPDKFRDIDMHSLTREFYSRFYHYNLTDSEINRLLNP